MAYIDYAFFCEYTGNGMEQTVFDNIVGIACDIVDSLTRYVVAQNGLSIFPEFIQTQFKKACAAECAYLNLYGVDAAFTGIGGQGFTVGKVSVGDTMRKGGGSMANAVSPMVYSLLQPTGLLYRGTAVYSDPFPGVFLPTVRY